MAHHEICVVLRDQNGAVIPLQSVNIWSDAAATTAATLYASATASTPTSNPTSTDADGLLRVWSDEPSLWYTTSTLGTALRLPVIPTEDAFNVRDFGAIGDGVTDDTDAFVAAVAAQRTQERATYDQIGGWHEVQVWPIVIPPGKYVVRTGELIIDYKGARILGSGRNNTWIVAPADYDDDEMFRVGYYAYQADVGTDYWRGSRAQQFELHNLTITRPASDGWPIAHTVERAGTGILDVGTGGMILENVTIRGFSYGFCAPYGHDFGYWYNVDVFMCDIGIYWALGTEQLQVYGLNVGMCNENIVFDNVCNIMLYGVNTSTPIANDYCTREAHDITFTGCAPSENTIYGVKNYWGGGCRAISIYNLWEERAFDKGYADPDTDNFREATRIDSYIYFESTDTAQAPHYNIVFYEPFVAYCHFHDDAGGTVTEHEWDITDHAWMKFKAVDGNQRCEVEVHRPVFVNTAGFESILGWEDRDVTNNQYITLTDPVIVTYGYGTPWWQDYPTGEPPVGVLVRKENWADPMDGSPLPGHTFLAHGYDNRFNLMAHNGHGVQIDATAGSGILDLSYATHSTIASRGFRFYTNFSADGGLLAFGDCSSTRKPGISYSDTNPGSGSGTWVTGDIVFKKTPAGSGKIGWCCTAGGTPGTWKEFGAIDA